MKKRRNKEAKPMWFSRIYDGVRRIFRAGDGGLRVTWQILFACMAYVVWLWGATNALNWYFSVLFGKLGITAANLSDAPQWTKALASGYGTIVSMVVNAGALALALGAYRVFSGKKFAWKPNQRAVCIGVGLGFLLAAVPAAVFLMTDSVRIDAVYGISAYLALMLAVYFVACMAEECFCRVLAIDMVRKRSGEVVAAIVSCGLFFLAGSGWALGWIGALNLLLMGLFCCGLFARHGFWASLGFRVAWSFASAAMFQFPGNTSVAQPVVALYTVSDAIWTGGGKGLISGLGITTLLVIGLLAMVKGWFFRKQVGGNT